MNRMTLVVVVVEVVLIALGLAGGWWFETPILETVRIDPTSAGVALAATVPLLAFVLWSMRSESSWFAGLRAKVREAIVPLFANCSVAELALIAVMAGIGEEIFFRAFLQVSLARFVDPWVALALVSVVFGLVHWVTPGYAVVAGLLGAYMGALLIVTGNLFVPVAIHALFDFVALWFISRMALAPAAEPGIP